MVALSVTAQKASFFHCLLCTKMCLLCVVCVYYKFVLNVTSHVRPDCEKAALY